MKETTNSQTRTVLLIVVPLLAILIAGAALLAGYLLGRAFDPDPTPTAIAAATSDAGLTAPTTTPTSEPSSTAAGPTATPSPSLEPSPSATSTTQNTSTPTPRPTNTPSPSPSPSLTPSVQIRTFTGDPDPIERGGTVTLTWDAPGALTVGITRLSVRGDIFLQPEALGLPAQGSATLQVPDDYVESVKYYLGARSATGELAKGYVTIGVICRYDEYIASRCPLTQDHPWAAYEAFERGRMIWREDTREIYVLHDNGDYETYLDTWQEGDPVTVPGTPPPGLYAPVRGFGNLYASQPQIAERLGWATAPENGYTMWVETIHGGSGRYPGISISFTLPGGSVINLYPFTSTWQSVP